VHQRMCTAPLSYPRQPALQRQIGAFAVVRGGAFGTGHPGTKRTQPGGRRRAVPYCRWGASRVRSAGDRRSRAVLAWCQ
jgi:hypothetical protein